MREEEIKKKIPIFPGACSFEGLAMAVKAVKRPYDGGVKNKRELKRFERRLAWLTLSDARLVERRLPMQLKTRQMLLDAGFPEPETRYIRYFSRLPLSKEKAQEEAHDE